jgi:hypothetical protein
MFNNITQHLRGNNVARTGDIPLSLGPAASNIQLAQDSVLPSANSTLQSSAGHIHYDCRLAANFCSQQLVYTEPLHIIAVNHPVSDALTNHSIPAATKSAV